MNYIHMYIMTFLRNFFQIHAKPVGVPTGHQRVAEGPQHQQSRLRQRDDDVIDIARQSSL